jgi:hypothetical protein
LIDHNMAPQCHDISAALLDAAADTPAALAAALRALGKDGELALQHAASFYWEASCEHATRACERSSQLVLTPALWTATAPT